MLIATVTAATLGGLIGFARGGSLARLAQLEIRLPWLAGLAWVIQVALRFLGDVLPLPPVGKVYSVGDLTAAVGVLLIVVQGMHQSPEVE